MKIKKYIALFFLVTAYAVLLAHNIVPHHHHETLSEAELHHLFEHNSHHHDNGEAEGHEHSPHLVHHVFAEDFRTPPTTTIDFAKQIQSNFNFSPFTFSLIAEVNICFESKPPDKEFLVYSSPHFLSSGLRAPPVLIF